MEAFLQKISNSLAGLTSNKFKRVELLQSASPDQWVCPAGVYYIDILMIGSGGDGGVGVSSTSGGGGGGGGGIIFGKNIIVVPGDSYSWVVGSGGGVVNTVFDSAIAGYGVSSTLSEAGVGGVSSIADGVPSILNAWKVFNIINGKSQVSLFNGNSGGLGGGPGSPPNPGADGEDKIMFTKNHGEGGLGALGSGGGGGGGGAGIYGHGGDGNDQINPMVIPPSSGTGFGSGGAGTAVYQAQALAVGNGTDGLIEIYYKIP